MKLFLLINTIILSTLIINAQNRISKEYFDLKCNCSLVNDYYNSSTKSHTYEFESYDGNSIYSIAIKEGKTSGEKGFLEAIKNAGVLNYKDTFFKGNYAIIADSYIDGIYTKHLNLFYKNKLFVIIIGATSRKKVNNIYSVFEKNLYLK